MNAAGDSSRPSLLLKTNRPVGISGYGAYVPMYRLPAAEIARVWGGSDEGLPIKEKAVPGLDEDTITMSIEAARNALKRAKSTAALRAVWIGLGIPPVRGQTSSTVVAEAIGAPRTSGGGHGIRLQGRSEAMVMAMDWSVQAWPITR